VSRITDVLRKAVAETAASGGTARFLSGEAVAPLATAEVDVPWVFQEPLGRGPVGGTDPDGSKVRVPFTAARTRAREPIIDEDIAVLVAQVFRRAEGLGARRVLFTAVDDGDASAHVAVRAAHALSSQGAGSVCLIDLDLRAPTVDRHCELQGCRGFSDALLDDAPIEAFIHRMLDSRSLSIMPAGSRTLEALAAIGGATAQQRLREVSDMFDYVVAHAAPAGVHADAALLGPFLDGAVLVLEANATRATAARAAAEALQRAAVTLLGSILNNRTYPIPHAIYRWL